MLVGKPTRVSWAQSVGAKGIRFNHGGVCEWVRRGLGAGVRELAWSGSKARVGEICSTHQYICLRLLMQMIRVKSNVEVAVIPIESNHNHL